MRLNRRPRGGSFAGAVLGLLLLAGVPGAAHAADTLRKALGESEPIVDLRYRLEIVDQDGFDHRALASTLRGRLGFKTGELGHFYALFDVDAVTDIGSDRFNSTANGRTDFPTVADPEDTEVNQVYVGYTGLRDWVFKLGRQRITLDNHRFLGNVGWRQNEQTFDAFSVKIDPVKNLSIFFSHANNVNRIFGEHNPNPVLADNSLGADFLHVFFQTPVGKIVGYAYLIENETLPSTSQKNFGLRFTGRHRLAGHFKLTYAGEYTDQSDYKDGSSIIDAEYYLLEGGVEFKKVSGGIGYEVLGGDGTYGFSTPLATLHAFQGWADVFLSTPADGIVDRYVSVAGEIAGIKLRAVYHDFSADEGSADYGEELDLVASRKFSKIYSVLVKYADYSADEFSVDTWKFWAQLGLKL